MHLTLMFLTALAVVALVLLLEQRGDPRLREREYTSPPPLPEKSKMK